MTPALKVDYSLRDGPENEGSMILVAQDDVESGNWSGDVEGSLWNTRGWTMQERNLATRMIHFCQNKLYFECRSYQKTEENEQLRDYRTFSMWPRNEEWMQHSQEDPGRATDTLRHNKLYDLWRRNVTVYTQRHLTKGSDKLPAIQSTASEMSATINDRYLPFAGMWERNLENELLWQVNHGPTARPEPYRAPTWSWASLDAKIQWSKNYLRPQPETSWVHRTSFEVLGVSHSDNGCEEGVLTIKGFLQPIAFINACDDDERWIHFTRVTFPYDLFIPDPSGFSVEVPLPISTLQERDITISKGQVIKFAEGRLDLDDTDDLTTSRKNFFYLHVNHNYRTTGLILEEVEGEAGMYKRVGVASLFTEQSDLIYQPPVGERVESVEVKIK